MYSILCVAAFSLLAIHAQENAIPEIPVSLRKCYNNTYLLTRDNRLPHNMISLIEIIRKVENTEGFSMNLRTLSVALLHKFRQDGMQYRPSVFSKEIIPYAPKHYKFNQFVKILKSIPGDARTFPNSSLSDIETCTLHFMLSRIIEDQKREGEEAICNKNLDNAYRLPRSLNEELQISSGDKNKDVEMLSPQQMQSMSNNKQRKEESEEDPNSFYPDFPPNHPAVAQLLYSPELSACPVESGVIKTRWGTIAAGPVIAAIAAAMEPQLININLIMEDQPVQPGYFENVPKLNNKWFATIAGDLAVVCRRQASQIGENDSFKIGVDGKWNSTNLPRWYFLNSNENLELTRAELRGDIDGLIIATDASSWNNDILNNLRLSQILDMYYSPRGLIDSSSRACYRKELFTKVAPRETLEQQTLSAIKVLPEISDSTIEEPLLNKLSKKAVQQLTSDIASSLKDDLSCIETDRYNDFNRPFIDLTIVLDTNWPFKNVQPMLGKLFEGIEVCKYNSNFTLINGQNGDVMINLSNTILDFYFFNASSYEKYKRGFNMPNAIETVRKHLEEKLDEEQRRKIGGSNANVVLFIPFSASLPENDKNFYLEQINEMREEIPDTSIVFLSNTPKDRWTDLVQNPSTDIFFIGVSDSNSALQPIDSLISRLKQFPKRLINSQCGSKYESKGSSESFTDYVEPRGVNFYRIHPNYFFTSEFTPKINFQGLSGGQLTICSSRELLYMNRSVPAESDSCKIITNNMYTVELSCGDASLIHECQPYYFSVTANSSGTPSYNCKDMNTCRFPDQISFKVSYENLVCTSGVSSIRIMPVTVILTIAYLFRLLHI